ncbi:MAG TPA: hypothetical protein VH143_01820 [Kofleriaceae bacterium]|nr:hypothetical protein [Kofleriaceae bacterium]
MSGFARKFIAFSNSIRQGRGPSQRRPLGGKRRACCDFRTREAMETDKSMTRPVLRRPDDDNDGLVALPPVPLVRQRLRASVKEFASSQPGRRAAALAAVWIAATGCEADLNHYDPEEALRTYRLIESELRAELRISLGRAITNEPHAATRNTMISMLEHLEELEAAAVAPRPARRRRRR